MVMPKLNNLSDNLKRRIISAVVLIPIVILICYFGGFVYTSILLVAAVIMSFEWNQIVNSDNESEHMKNKWQVAGIIYIVVFVLAMMYLQSLLQGFWLLMFIFAIVWATDIGAYFTGRKIGGPKILKKISPNKTWSGLLGGMLCAGFVAFIFALFVGIHSSQVIFFGSLLAVISQIGDFFESWFKRCFKVKDSGNIIPGHGGLLDRIDGLVSVAITIALIALSTDLSVL